MLVAGKPELREYKAVFVGASPVGHPKTSAGRASPRAQTYLGTKRSQGSRGRSPSQAGSGARSVDQLIQFVRNRLHLGWVGGLETAQTICSLNSQPSTLNQPGELAAHFARDQR